MWQADRYERPRALLLCVLEACPQLQGPYISAFPFSVRGDCSAYTPASG